MTEGSFTTEDVSNIALKAGNCLRKGLIEEKPVAGIIRITSRLLSGLRKELRGEVWDAEQRESDIAKLREADRMLSRLLAPHGHGAPNVEATVIKFPTKPGRK